MSLLFDVTVSLAEACLLTVRVRDAETLRPVVGALVVVDTESKTSGVEGETVFTLPYGSYTVRASRFDYETGEWSVTLAAPTQFVDAQLIKAVVTTPEVGILYGQVKEAKTMAPIPYALVVCNGRSMYADYQGYYAFTLPYADYTVKASASGYYSKTIPATVSSLEQRADFELERSYVQAGVAIGAATIFTVIIAYLIFKK